MDLVKLTEGLRRLSHRQTRGARRPHTRVPVMHVFSLAHGQENYPTVENDRIWKLLIIWTVDIADSLDVYNLGVRSATTHYIR